MAVNNLVDCIFKQELAPHFNLLNIVAVRVLGLDIHAEDPEKFRSDLEVVDPRNVADNIFPDDIRDLAQ